MNKILSHGYNFLMNFFVNFLFSSRVGPSSIVSSTKACSKVFRKEPSEQEWGYMQHRPTADKAAAVFSTTGG